MLQLQRASAGSGKTYMLAKKFIEFFISAKDEDGRRRLRRPNELRESLRHILAITFTNKATNEMKLRIVGKLDALANWTPGTPVGKIDYLAEFTKSFGCTPQEIADISRHALKVLLSDYSDFKVSTIDSFFQTVLRTFAYEADLDDTYQIELDSDYVTQMGLDTTLDAIETADAGNDCGGAEWIYDMMEQASSRTGWNIFQKKKSDTSIYGQVLKASANMAKEDFKVIRTELDDYFAENPDFYATFHTLCKFYEQDARMKFAAMRQAARDVRAAFAEAGLDMHATAGRFLAGRVDKMASEWTWDYSDKKLFFKLPTFTRKGTQSRVFDPRVENRWLDTQVEDRIEQLVVKMYECFDSWRAENASDKMSRWRIYRVTMPFIGLLQSVKGNARLFLTDSNTVELGETNSILNRIIGDDDAPFIYERLGSRLEHFLIDEFQDTSRLQWSNLNPLIADSEGKGHDNLIIGDAKQSIYRFRNADPSLITEKVPQQFAATCRECGNSPAENTNWRSSRRIVEFNNLFFRYLTRSLSPEMQRLYSNTVQPPHHSGDAGFVKVTLFKNEKQDDKPAHYADIPLLIADMLSRGYAMREIAVLVDTGLQGADVIDSIMAYNREQPADGRINFISADSLTIGESPAVQAIVSILEAINNGTRARLRPKEEWAKKGVGDWSKLKADFSFFAQRNQDRPLSELLSRFLNGEYNPDAINEMIATMTTTVLPALTENIIRNFISRRMRESEAPFIAAFQDCVLDFCEGSSADVSSFLNWWNKKGCLRSISSPEDADAVQIMTIHKSKGLEFRCVIVPHFKQTTRPASPKDKEWLWVRPDLHEAEGIPAIPWIPVWSTDALEATVHADIYRDYLRKYMTDKVNMAYVAFTRAIDELYIYIPGAKDDGSLESGKDRIGDYLWTLGAENDAAISEIRAAHPADGPYLPPPGCFEIDSQSMSWTFGKQPQREEVEATTASRMKKEKAPDGLPLREYWCAETIPSMLYCDPSSPRQEILPESEEEEDEENPAEDSEEVRAYGELMHSIMEHIATADDIDRALLRSKTRGHIAYSDIPRLRDEISRAIESVSARGWFEPGLKVVNERGLGAHGKILRPDRVILHPDGRAVIIDYKFGSVRNDSAYSRQIRRYAKTLLGAGAARSCEAYVWYVALGEILEVEI